MGDVRGKFMKPLMAVLPPPRTEDLEAFLAAYERILGEFDDDALDAAQYRLLRTMKVKSIPLPGDCLEACRTVQANIHPVSENKSRSTEEIMAERAHIGRLNTIAAEGDTERAARLMIILLKSHQTRDWDFEQVDAGIRYLVRRKLVGTAIEIEI